MKESLNIDFNTRVLISEHESDDINGEGRVLLDKSNAIHSQNMARAISRALAKEPNYFIHRIAFGNGGSFTDAGETTIINPPNDGTRGDGWESRLYNETYSEIIDEDNVLVGTDPGSSGPNSNRIGGGSVPTDDPGGTGVVSLEVGRKSNVIATMFINQSEPVTQLGEAADSGEITDEEKAFEFDELGFYTTGRQASPTPATSLVNVGNKTSEDAIPSNMNGSQLTLVYEIDGAEKQTVFDVPSIGSGPAGEVTFGDLCEGINTGSWFSPSPGADSSVLIKASITDRTSGAVYPSISGSETFGFLVFERLVAGSGNTLKLNCSTGQGSDFLFALTGDCSMVNTATNDGINAGVANDSDNTSNERERLLTHLTFSPILKKKNRVIKIVYTLTVSVSQTGDCVPNIENVQPLPSPSPSSSISATPSVTPSNTPDPSQTPSATSSVTPTPSGSSAVTPTPTPSASTIAASDKLVLTNLDFANDRIVGHEVDPITGTRIGSEFVIDDIVNLTEGEEPEPIFFNDKAYIASQNSANVHSLREYDSDLNIQFEIVSNITSNNVTFATAISPDGVIVAQAITDIDDNYGVIIYNTSTQSQVGFIPSPMGSFFSAYALAIDENYNIYVGGFGDSDENLRAFDISGTQLWSITDPFGDGSGVGGFNSSFMEYRNGFVYALSGRDARVFKVDTTGQGGTIIIDLSASLSNSQSLSLEMLSDDTLVFWVRDTDTIYRIDTDGNTLNTFSTTNVFSAIEIDDGLMLSGKKVNPLDGSLIWEDTTYTHWPLFFPATTSSVTPTPTPTPSPSSATPTPSPSSSGSGVTPTPSAT